MGKQAVATANRIMSIDWKWDFDKSYSRAMLMREYMRRAAWWAEALDVRQWPFFDIALAANDSVRAEPALAARIKTEVRGKLQGMLVAETCERAVQFAALMDSSARLPKLPESVMQPFEPLLVMFERGGGFRIEESGMIEVDSIGILKGTRQSNRADQPVIALDKAALDAADAAARR